MADEKTPEPPKAPETQPAAGSGTKSPSALWYVVAFLFGIIGGLIGYFVVKKQDPTMARNLLILGIIMTVVGIALNYASYMLLMG